MRSGLMRIVGSALLASAGIALGLFIWIPEDPVQAAPHVEVRLLGQRLDTLAARLDDASPEALAQTIAERFLNRPVHLQVGDRTVERKRRTLGARVDVAHLTRLIRDARDPESTLRLVFAETGRGVLDLPFPMSFDPEVTREYLLDLKDELDRPAKSARMDVRERAIVPEQIGRTVDVWATLDRLAEHLSPKTDGTAVPGTENSAFEAQAPIMIPVAIAELIPDRRAADLSDVRMHEVLGEFETRYNAAESAADRTHNLRVAGQHVDGLVLFPGETFDFNAIVGERSRANGFRPATVIAGGELVDGVGGGACQVAGTLHGAVFFAGLAIVDRNPHSRPSSYIKLGLDAAVSYPNLNFVFRNDLDVPVVLEFTVEDGIVRSRVWGPRRHRMVTFVRRVDGFTAFTEREEPDQDLPTGVRVLSQRGVPGFTVKRFQIVRDTDLNQAIRFTSEDRYPPTTQIWRVGRGPAAAEDYEPPAGDGHPEYRADAYLTMTQGPGIEGTLEQRRAGLTGRPGWTVDEGMPSATP